MTVEERRYRHGTVAHIVRPNVLDHAVLVSLCGIAAREHWWYGTGSQGEYERAASLPLCKRCRSKL